MSASRVKAMAEALGIRKSKLAHLDSGGILKAVRKLRAERDELTKGIEIIMSFLTVPSLPVSSPVEAHCAEVRLKASLDGPDEVIVLSKKEAFAAYEMFLFGQVLAFGSAVQRIASLEQNEQIEQMGVAGARLQQHIKNKIIELHKSVRKKKTC